MNDPRRATWWLILLPVLGLLLAGCPTDRDDFKYGVPHDDDDTSIDDDDDDSSAQNNVPPVLTVETTDPDLAGGEALAGTLEIGFTITDPDSEFAIVEVDFGVAGEDGPLVPASLVDEVENFVEVPGGPPLEDEPGTLIWDSATDIPTVAESPALRLCPIDSEGNEGDCYYVPFGDNPVVNTDVNDLGAFCQPGHLEEMLWQAGEALIPLSDGNCLNYQKSDSPSPDDFAAQFLLVLVNSNPDDINFTISPAIPPEIEGDDDDDDAADDDDSGPMDDDDSAAPAPAPPLQQTRKAGLVPVLTQAFGASSWRDLADDQAPAPAPFLTCEPDLTEADVHNNNLNFEFRDTIDDQARSARGADLLALGEHVAIYVDDETPIDWDADCDDPSNSIETGDLPAFGFTNCDLEEVVDVFDNNIYPTLTTAYGLPSDVDNNCRVTIFLSHRLNRLTQTNGTDEDDSRLVKSFTEPDIDLWGADLDLNPNSNEEEILFLYAPDPVGFWSDQTVQLDEYLNFEVHGRTAVAFQDLISYAVHREVEKSLLDPSEPDDVDNPPAEEDWLNDAMGLLAADITGFGAISYLDAWIYMDRAHLLSLQEENTLEDFEDRGGQFLFVRYLHEQFGDQFIWDVLHAENEDEIKTQGVDSIVAVLEAAGLGDDDDAGDDDDDSVGDDDDEDGDAEIFIDFTLQWATAMAISGRTNIAGGQLVPDTIVPNYGEPSFISVTDPSNPVPGEHYGANDYQTGFDVHGLNLTFEGGTDPAGATELEAERILAENLDPMIFHPQTDFFGTVSGRYGVATVLVSGLEQPINWLLVEVEGGSDLVGNVIRINDANPWVPLLTLEDVDGAKITTTRALDLPEAGNSLDALLIGGDERNVIGRIDEGETITLSPFEVPEDLEDDDDAARDEWADDDDSAGDDESEGEISDTDRYSFTLAGVATLGIWVDRRIASLDGNVELTDPFVAVIPASDVPDAFDYDQWNFGPLPSHGPCADMDLYNYPVVMPLWMASQANLLSNPVAEVASEFEMAVFAPDIWECMYDHDQDGVLDAEEPKPSTLMEQILLRQAENLFVDPTFYDATFGLLGGFGDVSAPWWGEQMIDIDSNEEPDDNFATQIPAYNLGGRSAPEGEEAVWMGTLPPGEYIILVGGAGGATGPYDLSVRLVQ